LGTDKLTMLRSLPVRSEIQVWTEDREREVLASAMACFLPVRSQSFSIAKSLNRAVTALTTGCQVLSTGFPLYAPIGSLIYRDASSFLDDLDRGSMRLSPERLDVLRETIRKIADPDAEASSLAAFLHGLARPNESGDLPLALVHGTSPSPAAHALVQSVGGMSVASPYCPPKLRFDVIFQGGGTSAEMLVSERILHRVMPEVRQQLRPTEKIAGRQYWVSRRANLLESQEGWALAPLPFQLATYTSTLRKISEQLRTVFGPCRTIIAESSPYPFDRAA
jgi:hypothetical protein